MKIKYAYKSYRRTILYPSLQRCCLLCSLDILYENNILKCGQNVLSDTVQCTYCRGLNDLLGCAGPRSTQSLDVLRLLNQREINEYRVTNRVVY